MGESIINIMEIFNNAIWHFYNKAMSQHMLHHRSASQYFVTYPAFFSSANQIALIFPLLTSIHTAESQLRIPWLLLMCLTFNFSMWILYKLYWLENKKNAFDVNIHQCFPACFSPWRPETHEGRKQISSAKFCTELHFWLQPLNVNKTPKDEALLMQASLWRMTIWLAVHITSVVRPLRDVINSTHYHTSWTGPHCDFHPLPAKDAEVYLAAWDYPLMSAMQTWMVKMDGRVHSQWVATMSQQGLQHQQGGSGVMFWARIMQGKELVGPFRVPERVKITSKLYVAFLTHVFHGRKLGTDLCQTKSSLRMMVQLIQLMPQEIRLHHGLLWT